MNKLTISIDNLPMMPVNRAKMVTRGMLIKTALCREFEKDLTSRIEAIDTREFFNAFHRGSFYIGVTYNLFCPKEDFYTKSGLISNKCPDADSIKILQDTIFRAINIDDKYIKDLTVHMRPATNDVWSYKITLELLPLEILYV